MNIKKINTLLDMVEYCKERFYTIRNDIGFEDLGPDGEIWADEVDETLDSIQKTLIEELLDELIKRDQTNV